MTNKEFFDKMVSIAIQHGATKETAPDTLYGEPCPKRANNPFYEFSSDPYKDPEPSTHYVSLEEWPAVPSEAKNRPYFEIFITAATGFSTIDLDALRNHEDDAAWCWRQLKEIGITEESILKEETNMYIIKWNHGDRYLKELPEVRGVGYTADKSQARVFSEAELAIAKKVAEDTDGTVECLTNH